MTSSDTTESASAPVESSDSTAPAPLTAEEHVKAALDVAADEIHTNLSSVAKETEDRWYLTVAAIRGFLDHLASEAEGELAAAATFVKAEFEKVG